MLLFRVISVERLKWPTLYVYRVSHAIGTGYISNLATDRKKL